MLLNRVIRTTHFSSSYTGSKVGKFTLVTLKGCDLSKSVCDLVRNTNASIEINFTVGEYACTKHVEVADLTGDR